MTFEAIEGIIDGVNANEKGTGFLLEGQPPNTWFNFSRVLPRDYQAGLTLPAKPPELTKGQQVRFLYETSKMGKRFIQVNPDGSHEFTILDAPADTTNANGGVAIASYAQEKNDAILWAVCLKLAGELYIARCSPDDERSVATGAVLSMAQELFQGSPNENSDPEKAAGLAETARVMAGTIENSDPGPQEPME